MMEENGPHDALGEPPDLLVPPHVLASLFDLLIGAWQPDSKQQHEMEAHLFTCTYCRVALIYLLGIAEEADRQSGDDGSLAHALLERWAELHRTLEVRAQRR